jgi:hypothetical protein
LRGRISEQSGAERGVGLFEAAAWIVALVPVALMGVSLAAVVHDRNHLSGIPAAVLRESLRNGLRWLPDGRGGHFAADVAELRAQVSGISQRAVAEAEQGLLKADSVSAKACFWIFSVNTSNGRLESPIWSECDARGPLSGELSLLNELARECELAQGISVGESEGFVDRVVITGVVVGAEARDVLDYGVAYRLSESALAFARQEVGL